MKRCLLIMVIFVTANNLKAQEFFILGQNVVVNAAEDFDAFDHYLRVFQGLRQRGDNHMDGSNLRLYRHSDAFIINTLNFFRQSHPSVRDLFLGRVPQQGTLQFFLIPDTAGAISVGFWIHYSSQRDAVAGEALLWELVSLLTAFVTANAEDGLTSISIRLVDGGTESRLMLLPM